MIQGCHARIMLFFIRILIYCSSTYAFTIKQVLPQRLPKHLPKIAGACREIVLQLLWWVCLEIVSRFVFFCFVDGGRSRNVSRNVSRICVASLFWVCRELSSRNVLDNSGIMSSQVWYDYRRRSSKSIYIYIFCNRAYTRTPPHTAQSPLSIRGLT